MATQTELSNSTIFSEAIITEIKSLFYLTLKGTESYFFAELYSSDSYLGTADCKTASVDTQNPDVKFRLIIETDELTNLTVPKLLTKYVIKYTSGENTKEICTVTLKEGLTLLLDLAYILNLNINILPDYSTLA